MHAISPSSLREEGRGGGENRWLLNSLSPALPKRRRAERSTFDPSARRDGRGLLVVLLLVVLLVVVLLLVVVAAALLLLHRGAGVLALHDVLEARGRDDALGAAL